MSATKREMTGGMPSHSLAVHQGVVHFECLRSDKTCEFPIALRVVRDGFAVSQRLYKGIRFDLVATIRTAI